MTSSSNAKVLSLKWEIEFVPPPRLNKPTPPLAAKYMPAETAQLKLTPKVHGLIAFGLYPRSLTRLSIVAWAEFTVCELIV